MSLKINKKHSILFLALVLLITSVLGYALASSPAASTVYIYLDGQRVSFPDQRPYINNENRTLVPIRFVAETLGAEVKWDSGKKQIDIDHADKSLQLWIGKSEYRLNGSSKRMDTQAALTQNSRTMVPLRFVSEGLGLTVEYKNQNGAGHVFLFRSGMTAAEKEALMGEALSGKLPAVFPKEPEVLERNQWNSLAPEQYYRYYQMVFDTIVNNRETGEFSFSLPHAPAGYEWHVGLTSTEDWRKAHQNRVRYLDVNSGPKAGNREYSFICPTPRGSHGSMGFVFFLVYKDTGQEGGVASYDPITSAFKHDEGYMNRLK